MIHNTHFSQYIPPTLFHSSQERSPRSPVRGRYDRHEPRHANETSVITIPIMVPSNSVALQGAKLASIEVDYVVKTGEPTSSPGRSTRSRVERMAPSPVSQPSPRRTRSPQPTAMPLTSISR